MAYEILYARKVDLWDKLKEVKFSQLFPYVSGWLVGNSSLENSSPKKSSPVNTVCGDIS
jgi:hypothetical protein